MKIFEKLKKKSLRKHTERNIVNRDNSEINDPLVTLGIIVDESLTQDFDSLYDLSRVLGLQRKDVKVFSFLEVRRRIPTLRQNQINNKDFTWKGEISNQNAKEFLERPFDVLIGYYNGRHEFLDLMVSESKAKFKVGVDGANDRLYDLLMTIDTKDIEGFKNELFKYLKILKKI